MKLIVGLGNPGIEYDKTRHNVGFMIVDKFAKDNNLSFSKKFDGMYAKMYYHDQYFMILKPLSFMNLSGTVIKKYMDYYQIKGEDILVIHDDLDMPLGKIKLKAKGSSGGHNGIKNIIELLGTDNFSRFKIGIGKDEKINTKDYVLGTFSKKDLEILDKIMQFSNDIIEDFLNISFDKMMCKYNGDIYEIK